MKLGVDFGTTRIVASMVDRGNYPLVSSEGPEGEPRDWFPPLIALRGSERLYGWDAWKVQCDPDATVAGSTKPLLRHTHPEANVQSLSTGPMLDPLTALASAFRTALGKDSNVHGGASEPWLEIMLGIPVNANSDHRFVTTEAFRRAGFVVMGLLENPVAASLEFQHVRELSGGLLVYHLGGRTFEDGDPPRVVASEGLADFGGDNFDVILAELAWEAAGNLPQADLFWLHEKCQHKKEGLAPLAYAAR